MATGGPSPKLDNTLDVPPPTGRDPYYSARNTPEPQAAEDPTQTLNQIRKWGCYYDGKDPLSFLEQIEDLNDAYCIPRHDVLTGLPLLLKGDALLWHRNFHDAWGTWNDFRRDFLAQYLAPGYQRQLRREVHGRRQKAGEAFNKYATAVLTMMRRAGGYTQKEQLDQLYENADPELQLYVRRDEVVIVAELYGRAASFEEILHRRQDRQRESRKHEEGQVAAATYDRSFCCWRCKQ